MESSKKIKGVFSHTFVYTFGNLFSRGLNFLLLPVYSHFITPESFGIYSVIVSVLTIVSTVLNLGLPGIFLKYLSSAETSDEKKNFLSNVFSFISLTSVPLLLIITVFSKEVSELLFQKGDYSLEIILGLISIYGISYSYYFSVFYIAEERSKDFVTKSLISSVTNFVFNIFFVVLIKWGINGIFVSQILSSAILIFLSREIIIDYLRLKLNINYLKPIIISTLPLLFSGIFTIVVELIDRFIVLSFLGEFKAGIYSFGYRLALIFNLYVLSFKSAWIPHYFGLKSETLEEKAIHLGRVFTKLIFSSALLILIINVGVNEIFKLGASNFLIFDLKYSEASGFIIYILIGYFFNLMMGFYSIAPYQFNKLYHFLIADLIAMILNVTLNLYLIPLLGITGAAIATMISFFGGALYLFIYNYGKIIIRYEIIPLLIITLIGVLVNSIYNINGSLFIALVGLFFLILTGLYFRVIKSDWKEILKV